MQNLGASRIREVANVGMGRDDVLPFWFGEPDEVTPAFIRDAAKQALDAGDTFYTHNLGLPQLRATLAAGRDWTCACLDTLFVLMAELNDTNVMHRGGVAGAALVRRRAREFISMGGTANADWRAHAADMP